MTEIDSTRILTPLSPTYMPYFPPHRSPLHSSSNTRQRDDYEFSSSHSSPPSPSPQVLVTLTDDEDGDGTLPKPDRLTEGYPAWELPFASEPALEGELEQGLPPLKKLKPDQEDTLVVGTRPLLKNSPEGIVLLGAVKGILTKRESSSTPHSPSASSPICPETCFAPWSRPSGLGLTTSSISTPHQSSTPLSRRSSSGASSACAGSLKAVRFASGHGFPNGLGALEPSLPILPGQVEGPVAAIMYLTHSAEAYDRSPIIVENGLRLPPRAKPDDEDDVAEEESHEATLKPASPSKPPTSPQKKRRAKINLELAKISPASQLCASPEALSPRADSDHETSIVIKLPSSLSAHRSYREIKEVDEEEEEEEEETQQGGARGTLEEEAEEENEEDAAQEPPEEADNSEDEEDENHHHHHHLRIPTENALAIPPSSASSGAQWGLGKWSSGEVFESCDALGGF
ncbi:hypothetical protein PTTG_01266 [Puccinia triticina 1-1 BBBD Race 1]|uniref:Uncharacterized protein n=1 Tax=Puccinia triticina (isolate 1-1 / race 1 (BBBD)) TaxID=630390 RepID=A0A0C4EKJ0_PUCT1|nr:hypothetical protein PTTG_01266 [Puccinia triticina 1-1 BBBD Race 1]